MSELEPVDGPPRNLGKLRVVWQAGKTALGGAAGGLYLAMQQPITFKVGSVAEAEMSGSSQDRLYVESTFWKVNVPDADVQLPLAGDGADIRLDYIQLPNKSNLAEYASLLDSPQSSIIGPARQAVIERAELGMGLGAAMALTGLAAMTAGRKYFRKHWRLEPRQQADGQEASWSAHYKRARRGGLALMAGTFLALNSSGEQLDQDDPYYRIARSVLINEQAKEACGGELPNPTSKYLVQKFPVLKDSTICGGAGEIVDESVRTVLRYKMPAERPWIRSSQQISPKLNQLRRRIDFLNNPYIEPLIINTDSHCSYLQGKYFLPKLVEATGARMVYDLGDNYVNMGQELYEKGKLDCFDLIAKPLETKARKLKRKVTYVRVRGNHDSKKAINQNDNFLQVVTLDKSKEYTFIPQGAYKNFPPVVGTPDLTETMGPNTKPEDLDERAEVIAEQARITAAVARQVRRKYDRKPFVFTHRKAASSTTILEGNALMTASGHDHYDVPPRIYENEAGDQTIQNTLGSSSGSDNKQPLYYKPSFKNAASRIVYYNTLTRSVEGIVRVTIKPTGQLKLKVYRMPLRPRKVIAEGQVENYLVRDVDQARGRVYAALK